MISQLRIRNYLRNNKLKQQKNLQIVVQLITNIINR
jgi:hypothetical protein